MHSQNTQARTRLGHITQLALVALSLPFVPGVVCDTFTRPLPPRLNPLELTAAQLPTLPQSVLAVICSSGPDALDLLSINGIAKEVATIKVTGPTESSRPQVIVFDNTNGIVMTHNGTQTSHVITVAFKPDASQVFTVLIKECGDVSQATAQSTPYQTDIRNMR
jgi:hypothetical protein